MHHQKYFNCNSLYCPCTYTGSEDKHVLYLLPEETRERDPERLPHVLVAIAVEDGVQGAPGEHEIVFHIEHDGLDPSDVFGRRVKLGKVRTLKIYRMHICGRLSSMLRENEWFEIKWSANCLKN